MPKGQVIAKGRIIHDYHTRLHNTIDSISITNGHAATTNNSVTNVGVNKEAVRGNGEVQGHGKSQRVSKTSYD